MCQKSEKGKKLDKIGPKKRPNCSKWVKVGQNKTENGQNWNRIGQNKTYFGLKLKNFFFKKYT